MSLCRVSGWGSGPGTEPVTESGTGRAKQNKVCLLHPSYSSMYHVEHLFLQFQAVPELCACCMHCHGSDTHWKGGEVPRSRHLAHAQTVSLMASARLNGMCSRQ